MAIPEWQRKLEQYRTDPTAARAEIARAKSVYDQELAAWQAAGNSPQSFHQTDRAKQIHTWANQVREAAGIDYSDPYYGNDPNTYIGLQQRQPAPVTQQPTLPQQQDQEMLMWQAMQEQMAQQQSQTDQLIRSLLQTMQQMSDPYSSPGYQAMMEQARQQAEREAQQRRQAFQNLVSSLEGAQASELDMLNTQLATSRQSLEDRTFQEYLAARQAMANRGLAGSGLASDQDTRLLLSQGRELARLGQQGQAMASEIMRRYGNQLSQAYQQMASFNQSDREAELLQQLMQSGNQNLQNVANLYLDLIGHTIGYDRVKPADLLRLQFDYDKLSSEEQRALMKMSLEDKRFYQQLNAESQIALARILSDYEIRMTDIMGMDQNGNPTLDALKLSEQIRSNMANESIRWGQIEVDSRRVDENIRQFNAELQLNYDKLRNSQWSQQAANLVNMARLEGDAISMLVKQLEALPSTAGNKEARQAIQEQISEHLKNYASYVKTIDELTYAVDFVEGDSSSVPSTKTPSLDPNDLLLEMFRRVRSSY